MEIGRICVKIAGRDAGNICVVVDNVEKNYVLIDGNVRRRKCNVFHLEPTADIIKIKKGASHKDVEAEFKKHKFDVWNTKPKKEKSQKPVRLRKPPAEKKPKEKKAVPKQEKKEEKPKAPEKKSTKKEAKK